jgi:hypothetical protein
MEHPMITPLGGDSHHDQKNKNHPHKSFNGQSPWLFVGQTFLE